MEKKTEEIELSDAQRIIMGQAVRLLTLGPDMELADCLGRVDSLIARRIQEKKREELMSA